MKAQKIIANLQKNAGDSRAWRNALKQIETLIQKEREDAVDEFSKRQIESLPCFPDGMECLDETNGRFKDGDKVEWNAGWNDNISAITNKPVGFMWRGPYDFGYYSSAEGKVVLYEEGCRNMQDSICVFAKDVRLVNHKK